jgi:hypothetical protein
MLLVMPGERRPPIEVDAELHRREHARLRVGIPAYFETLEGRLRVRLVDISQGGAHLILPGDVPIREGVLMWMRFDVFGMTVWQQDDELGMKFERPLPREWLIETREVAPDIVREEALGTISAARDFVAGHGRSGTER